MLLRRVTAHVRDQNWTAIGIDLVIVVVGVFIGIQVSNWNEARKDATTRDAYVALLVADLESIEARAARDVELYSGRVTAYRRVLEFLRSDADTPSNRDQFEQDLALLQTASAPIPRSPTVVELISSGRLGAMFTGELRVEVVRFDQLLQAAERAAEVITDIWRHHTQTTINRRVTFIDRISDDGRELLSSDVEYDLAPMRSDPDLLPALSAVMRSNLLEVEWRGAIAEQAEELRRRLEGLP